MLSLSTFPAYYFSYYARHHVHIQTNQRYTLNTNTKLILSLSLFYFYIARLIFNNFVCEKYCRTPLVARQHCTCEAEKFIALSASTIQCPRGFCKSKSLRQGRLGQPPLPACQQPPSHCHDL